MSELDGAPTVDTAVCVLEFSWADGVLVDQLKEVLLMPRINGGLGLNVFTTSSKKSRFLITWLSGEELCSEAELCSLQKRTPDQRLMLPFSRATLFKFLDDTNDKKIDDVFVSSEKQFLLLNRLRQVKLTEDMTKRLSALDVSLEEASGCDILVYHLFKSGKLKRMFPLHNPSELTLLKQHWIDALRIDFDAVENQIKDYFGLRITMYFAFLAFYTKALAVPACAAIVFWLVNISSISRHLIFSAFNLIWVTLFLCMWKRQSATLAYEWGGASSKNVEAEHPRLEYKGTLRINKETQCPELSFPRSARLRVMLTRTYPAVFGCLCLAVVAMAIYFPIQLAVEGLTENVKNDTVKLVVRLIPSILYTLGIVNANTHYAKLAGYLNDQENHRLPSDYGKHLIFKLLLFHFVNSFGFLFYVAFYLQDFSRLNRYLMCLLLTSQISQQIMEVGVPYFSVQKAKLATTLEHPSTESENGEVSELERRVKIESRMEPYQDTFDDYLELWLQFGYAFLFSPVFPFAAVLALLNNVVEMRSDAFKLCTAHQRPFAQQWANTGIWQDAFSILGALAVITNGALMALSPETRNFFKGWTELEYVLLFVIFEHIVVAVQILLTKAIPAVPEHVQLAIDRSESMRREAFRNEQIDYYAATKKLRRINRSSTVDNSGLNNKGFLD